MAPVSAPPSFTLLRAARLIDARRGDTIQDGALLVEGDIIRAAGRAAEVRPPDGVPPESVLTLDYPDGTILPGLVDTHVHLNGFGDGRAGDDLASLPDELLLLQAARNARRHLESGVTTLRDCGAKGQTTFRLRDAMRQGIVGGSRLVLCGRPITITGGHLWYFGQEADGVDAVREAVRQLVKEGADFIKVAATGGSTRTSDATRAAYTVEELRALVDEAHRFGKPVAAHCSGTQGVAAALDAGMGEGDTIIHCVFREPDGSTRYLPEIAERLATQRVWVDLTLAQSGARERLLRARAGMTDQPGRPVGTGAADAPGTSGAHAASAGLTERERAELASLERARAVRRDHVERLFAAGIKVVCGSDSSWGWYVTGEYQYEVIDHAEWGMGAVPALLSATRDAAACLRLSATTGTLEPGKAADVLVVDGDPTTDVRDLLRVRDVLQAGRRVARSDGATL
jgi:imidazolonepropionase-like amidohydrolase